MQRFLRSVVLVGVGFGLAGCAMKDPQPQGLVGDRSAHFTDVWVEPEAGNRAPLIAVDHVFKLRNATREPVTIVSHQTRIETVWKFIDSNDGKLPRIIEPGETVEIGMTAKVRKPEPQRYFTHLTLDTGEVITLEMFVED